ncbi:replication protein [Mergibacter septicus]|uniref:replication endonuclease n=1 Tax=Mergibacter septicus TaxID=221402 RepID=UPI001C7520BC|nr:replication endonuclease [Mergibacter septicus]QDJ13053.1 replication protein [Mergibacter septicus]
MGWEQERDAAIAKKMATKPFLQHSDYVVCEKPAPIGLSMSQLDLFYNVPREDFDFANEYFCGVPDYLAGYFVKRYSRLFKNKGRFSANSWLRQTMEKGVLSRIDAVMERYPISKLINLPKGKVIIADSGKGEKHLNKVIGLDEFSDHELADFARETAVEMNNVFFEFQETVLKRGVKTEDEINQVMKGLYQKLAYLTKLKGVEPLYYKAFRKGCLTPEKMDIAMNKMLCEKWWANELLKARSFIREHLKIAVGQVQKSASPYASHEAVAEWRAAKKRTKEFVKQMSLINQDDEDEVVDLQDMYYATVSNPAIRRAELMVRMRGFEEVAKELEYAGEFYTLTAPSCYHAIHSKGGFVKKWNFSSPKDTQKYLCSVWAKIRSSLDRRKIKVFGFRVVEPHHDGTPHWHLLLFMQPRHVETVREVFSRYALEEDGEEAGAQEHRFTAKAIDWEKGSATGYIAKYIAKNIDGYACDDEEDDETGEKLKDMAKNVSAWAAKWRIRQFQQIGGSPVTVWRELRRKHGEKVKNDEALTALVEAADRGDWKEYTLLQGGAFVKRKELVARTAYEDREPNKYGEISRKIIGFFNQKKVEIKTIFTRLKQWRIVKKASLLLSKNKNERSEANLSARSAAWSSVNNCTEGLNKQECDSGSFVGFLFNISDWLANIMSKKSKWLRNSGVKLSVDEMQCLDKHQKVTMSDGRVLIIDKFDQLWFENSCD